MSSISDLIKALNLPGTLSLVKANASSMTATDSENAGFSYYDSFDALQEHFGEARRNACRVNDIFETLSEDMMVLKLKRFKKSMASRSESEVPSRERISLEILDLTDGPTIQENIKTSAGMINLCNAAIIEHIHAGLIVGKVSGGGERVNPYRRTYTLTKRKIGVPSSSTEPPPRSTNTSSIKLEIIPPHSNADRDTTSHYDPWWTLGLMTTEDIFMSEMSIVQLLGGSVRSAFVVPECKVMSDLKVPSTAELRMSPNKDPKPDFATVFETNPKERYERLLAPVFAVGEVKQEDKGIAKASSASPNTAIFTSQMQAAVFPTLILFILLRSLDKTLTSQLPGNYIIYGVYMDNKNICVYAHFPYYEVEKGGWRFIQAKVARYNIPNFGGEGTISHREKENASRRLKVMLGLITVRARVAKSKDWFLTKEKKNWNDLASLWKQVSSD